MTKYLEIGQIVNTFGIKGFVKVKPFTENTKKRFDNLKTIYMKSKKNIKEYEIEEIKYHKEMVLVKFKTIDTIEEAENLRNSYLVVDREKEEPLEEGTYYIVDLIGIEVFTDEGEKLGILEDVFTNDIGFDSYIIKNELGKTIVLPAVEDIILNIDIKERKMTVHLIKGLIE